MNPKITQLSPKLLIGISAKTKMVDYAAPRLWQQFMPKRSTIPHVVDHRNYSIQIHDEAYDFAQFTPQISFTYWAATEVHKQDAIMDDTPFSYLEIPGGLYAVFLHKGTMETFYQTLQTFYMEWLPDSGYKVDQRPHFELLDERYLGHTNADSQEEIWVPITPN